MERTEGEKGADRWVVEVDTGHEEDRAGGEGGRYTELDLGKPCLHRVVVVVGVGVTCSDRHTRSGSQLDGTLVLRQHCKQMSMRGTRSPTS